MLPIAAATLPRETRALAADLAGAARQVRQPVLLLLGTASPPWASQITRELGAALPAATVTELPGAGHQALGTAPDLLVTEVLRFLGDEPPPASQDVCGSAPIMANSLEPRFPRESAQVAKVSAPTTPSRRIDQRPS